MDYFLLECPLQLFSNSIHIGEKLGEGANSSVFQCVLKGNEYAVKVLTSDIYEINEQFLDDVLDECKLLQKINKCEQCISTTGFTYEEDEDETTNIYIIMEKLNTDLYKYIQDENFWTSSRKYGNQLHPKPETKFVVFNNEDRLHWCYHMPLSKKKKITLSILSAVRELHIQKIVHADIKSNNMGYHYSNGIQIIKLFDFGASIDMEDYQEVTIEHVLGTEGYRAPEQDEGTLSYSSDVYSMGITIIELWNGDIWGEGEGFKKCRNEVLYGLRKIEKENKPFGTYLRKCVHVQPQKRPTIKNMKRTMTRLFKTYI